MDSVVHTSGRVKCVGVDARMRDYRLVKGDLGCQVKRLPVKVWGKRNDMPIRKKGDIKGLSVDSQSRLRVFLSTCKWSGSDCRRYGLTLTLPWAAAPDEWRKIWNRYVQRLIKQYPTVGMVWRIELTTGKAKRSGGHRRCHVHAVVWIPSGYVISTPCQFEFVKGSKAISACNLTSICEAWVKAWDSVNHPPLDARQWEYATSFGARKGFGIVIKPLDGSTHGCIHYLCDHATKHKEEQLGWVGRQWGVVNRKCFEGSDDCSRAITGKDWAIAKRQLRRLSEHLRKAGAARSQPYGDNKCFFGASEKALERVLQAVKDGTIC